MHSAKFIDGKRAYEFARKGIDMELKPVNVVFSEIELLAFGIPDTKIRIRCSKGTYIRSFARDLGTALGSGCYLSALERSSIGKFKLADAYSLEKFDHYLKQMKQI
jgi:tRNA pseudouridine55 synthase